ncbi:class II aldolase/adducin family protein [Streptomyces genisteinicus]|uniref:Class II aldolase/adducin family protein n=1 Tax=Streptomyces genisteinicus TaxID=2768068 RepID=A0A7H0HXZ2_9ACTN|nr:class II aldolase/adducin family protein [Streptomyces genisteinicus]QNP65408.1 class II aldolase/adducin family protein [Streptomyces genisteinicus]
MKPVRVHEHVGVHRRLVLLACRSLDRAGEPDGAAGCVSVRSGGAVVLSTGDTDAEESAGGVDTVLVDPDQGLPLLGELARPPAAAWAHLALHRWIPGGEAVVHTRDPAVLAGAEALGAAPAADARVLVVSPGRSASGRPGAPGPSDLTGLTDLDGPTGLTRLTGLTGLTEATTAVLLVGTGVFTWGREPDEALARLERIRELGRALPPVPAVGRTGPRRHTR